MEERPDPLPFLSPSRTFLWGIHLKNDLWGYVMDKGYSLHPAI
jgi:hypothetical protein